MNIHSRILAATLLVGGAFALPALAVTPAGSGAAVNTQETKVAVINAVLSSVDVQRGLLVASGRTYHFDPAAVSFSDDRRERGSAGLAGLKAGTKVTLRATQQNSQNRLLQVIAHD